MKKILVTLLLIMLLMACSSTKVPEKNKESNLGMKEISSLNKEGFIISDVKETSNKLIVYYSNIKESSNKIAIVDAITLEPEHEIEHDNQFIDGIDIVVHDEGFHLDSGPLVTLYDFSLNKIDEINLEKLMNLESLGVIWHEPFSFSQDLENIAYVDHHTQSLVIKNIKTNKEEIIYHINNEQDGIVAFNKLQYLDEYIGFAAQKLEKDKSDNSGSNLFGRINVESKNIEFFETENKSAKIQHKTMILYDNRKQDIDYKGSGVAIVYNPTLHEQETIELQHSDTSFDVDFLTSSIIVSYNDIANNKTKLLLYGKENLNVENVVPKEVFDVKAIYSSKRNSLLVYFSTFDHDQLTSDIKELKIK